MLHPLPFCLFYLSYSPELRKRKASYFLSVAMPESSREWKEARTSKDQRGSELSLLLSKQCSIATDHRDSFAFLDLFPSLGDTGIWHCWWFEHLEHFSCFWWSFEGLSRRPFIESIARVYWFALLLKELLFFSTFESREFGWREKLQNAAYWNQVEG